MLAEINSVITDDGHQLAVSMPTCHSSFWDGPDRTVIILKRAVFRNAEINLFCVDD